MIEITLGVLLLILIGLGLAEAHFHRLALAELPIRIHVNGSRGKSSVTRLVAAGLRAGGLKTLAKTTGTSPRIIDEEGKDRIIHRLRSASIGEQVRLLRNFAGKRPDAIVIECMAVQPQYQWIAEQKMIKSTISVITNVRPDHLDEMGLTLKENALSLSNTIPQNGQVVTTEKSYAPIIEGVAQNRNAEISIVDSELVPSEAMGRFSYLEHKDNVALALKVCEFSGVDNTTALDGMVHAQPDPGATVIWKLKCGDNINNFVNVFAANDPASTIDIWNQLQTHIQDSKTCIFLNTRDDRRYRTNQLLSVVYEKMKPEMLFVRGDNISARFHKYQHEHPEIKTIQLPNKINIKEIMFEFSQLNNFFIVGIGNMVGWGQQFISDLKSYRV